MEGLAELEKAIEHLEKDILPTQCNGNVSCYNEHVQLYNWLKELKGYKEKIANHEKLQKDFNAKNMMMSVKYWPDGENEDEGGSPQIVQDVTSVKRDPLTGEFVIGTIFEDIRIPCKKYDTVIEVGA